MELMGDDSDRIVAYLRDGDGPVYEESMAMTSTTKRRPFRITLNGETIWERPQEDNRPVGEIVKDAIQQQAEDASEDMEQEAKRLFLHGDGSAE